jgi:hypothetical protein
MQISDMFEGNKKTEYDEIIELMRLVVEKWVNDNGKKGEFEFYYNYFCDQCELPKYATVVYDMITKNIINRDLGFDYLLSNLK